MRLLAALGLLDIDLPLDVTFDAGGAMYVADSSGQIFKIGRAI